MYLPLSTPLETMSYAAVIIIKKLAHHNRVATLSDRDSIRMSNLRVLTNIADTTIKIKYSNKNGLGPIPY